MGLRSRGQVKKDQSCCSVKDELKQKAEGGRVALQLQEDEEGEGRRFLQGKTIQQ